MLVSECGQSRFRKESKRKSYLQKHFSRPKRSRLSQLAIDEISVGKGPKHLTVVLDLTTGAVVFVGDGKGAEALKPFWRRLRRSRARIQAVAMDNDSS